jgi:protein SCO1/2
MTRLHPRLVLAAAALMFGAACASPHEQVGQLRGTLMVTPLAKADFTLTAADGRPYDFRRETDGYLTLLYFGYTNCADVCPVQLSNIAAVLNQMPYDAARRVKVVFVTTDPARDTPAVLRKWLDAIDPSFVGLRGSPDEVARVQELFNLPPAVREAPLPGTTTYQVGHAAQVIAFTGDDSAHVVYPFGTRQEDWNHDLPILLSNRWALPHPTS